MSKRHKSSSSNHTAANSWSCRSVDHFEKLNRVEEGAYGIVYRARNKATGEVVALKRVKNDRTRQGFPLTALREINMLINLEHPNVVRLYEVAVGKQNFFLVMEWLSHDLQVLMEEMREPFRGSEVKCLMLQLLEGVRYMHENWVIHRDLKTSNLLLNNKGELKIADFGLARAYSRKPMTPGVCTLYYRAPEVLLGGEGFTYTTAIDMWSCGCIFGELIRNKVLIGGTSEMDQMKQIVKLLGAPTEKIWPSYTSLPHGNWASIAAQGYHSLSSKFPPQSPYMLSVQGTKLLLGFLQYNPETRLTAAQAIDHPYFTSESPKPKNPEAMPSFKSVHEGHERSAPSEQQQAAFFKVDPKYSGSLFGGPTVNTDSYLRQLEQQPK